MEEENIQPVSPASLIFVGTNMYTEIPEEEVGRFIKSGFKVRYSFGMFLAECRFCFVANENGNVRSLYMHDDTSINVEPAS